MLATLLLFGRQDAFTLASDTALLPSLGLLALLAAALAGRMLGMTRLAMAGTAFLQLTLFTIGGVMLSYVLTARGGPLWDARLAAWDAALGFDWPAIRSAVDRSGALATLLGLAYYSLIPQMIVAVVALSATARFAVLRITVAAAILSGFATVLIAGLMPAAGNLFDPAAYRHLWPPIALSHAELIAGLRNGSMRVLDVGAMEGIITFPSYHAALAAIFIWAFRSVPMLALPGGLWAGLTIIATPLGGGHYAADVIAGLGLAAISVGAAHRLVRIPAPKTDSAQVRLPLQGRALR